VRARTYPLKLILFIFTATRRVVKPCKSSDLFLTHVLYIMGRRRRVFSQSREKSVGASKLPGILPTLFLWP
jgi:hypothetical protein